MSENENKLTPWQEKNLEYQRRKAAEKKLEEEKNTPKKSRFTSPFQKKEASATTSEANEVESSDEALSEEEATSAPSASQEEIIFSKLEQTAEEVEELRKPRRSFFAGSGQVFKKLWPAFVIALLVFIGAVYAVSPLSKIGSFTVSGNKSETPEQVAVASQLKTGDSIFSILRNKELIATKIEKEFPRIASVNITFRFPNHFEAVVTEYSNSAYVKRNDKDYIVLSNGYVIPTPVDTSKLEKLPVLQDFSDEQVKLFVKASEKLKPELRALMTTVTKTPTDATPDFIAIDMSDGNQVRVPLSQMSEKLPYYPSIAKQIEAPQVVDMEASIYTKPKEAYQAYISQLSSSKAAASSAKEKKTTESSTDTTEASTTTASE
ncbi:cell division protein FtsQ/DivIB [Lactococcus taiwanensis]|uniref:cell division protein FtsQ/DivIB n=1 Tax=Lactococcus taiwanensis TaxID=1151742 RepID=UPI00289B6D87|nr:FtsQ-type POTRA domain-containing protein [Lactococcus taiwanensis]